MLLKSWCLTNCKGEALAAEFGPLCKLAPLHTIKILSSFSPGNYHLYELPLRFTALTQRTGKNGLKGEKIL